MKNEFLQKEVIDLLIERSDCKDYKTDVLRCKDVIPCLIFTPKGFKNFQENNRATVIGTVKVGQRKYKEPIRCCDIGEKIEKGIIGVCEMQINDEEKPYKSFDIYKSVSRTYSCVGYASVGNDEYVKLVRTNPLWLLLLLLIAIVIICGLKSCGNEPPKNPFDEVDGGVITTEAPNYKEYMANNHYLYVWRDRTVTKDKPTVPLVNHPDNDVYLCYDMISEDGTTLDSTGAFKPNTQIDYDFYKLFGGKTGTHKITLLIKVYDLKTKDELCSKTMPVEITIN